MWPDRRLLDRLDIVHPIIQAPMGGAAMLAGQGYPLSRALPAGELVQTLVRETGDILATMRGPNVAGARTR